jgi:hypothetical protein
VRCVKRKWRRKKKEDEEKQLCAIPGNTKLAIQNGQYKTETKCNTSTNMREQGEKKHILCVVR